MDLTPTYMGGGPVSVGGGRAPSTKSAEQLQLERDRADEKKRLKRAANRRSACTSRVRKKQFVEEMTAANERLQAYGAILARAPPTVTVGEGQGGFTVTSTCECSDGMCQRKCPLFENSTRDDLSSQTMSRNGVRT